MTKKDFNEFRFSGLNYREQSNKYLTMNRVSEDESKIVVRVSDNQIIPTKFGYALIIDATHVVFVKDWQVSESYFGIEVILDKNFWNVKEWGDFSDQFSSDTDNADFNTWKQAAIEQDARVDDEGTHINRVKWAK